MNLVNARTIMALGLAALLMGAAKVNGASAFDSVHVVVDVKRIAARAEETPRVAQVQTTDVRTEAGRTMERTTIGAVSMGAIHLDPSAPDIVRAIVEAKADELLARRTDIRPQTIHCGLFLFEIATPATLLYWDASVRIEVGLRVQDRERTISATAVERSFLWPSRELLTRVTGLALEQLSAEIEKVLAELLLPPP
jgi:hypothetical protein